MTTTTRQNKKSPSESKKKPPEVDLEAMFADRRLGVDRRARILKETARLNDQRKLRSDRRKHRPIGSSGHWWLKRNYVTFESKTDEL